MNHETKPNGWTTDLRGLTGDFLIQNKNDTIPTKTPMR